MKANLLIFLFLSFYSFSAGAQDEIAVRLSTEYSIPDGVYMLDSAASYKRITQFPVDIETCFLQIEHDYVVMYYRLRGKETFISGPVSNKKVINVDGQSISAFTVVTDNKFAGSVAGKRIFIGVTADGSKPLVYELDVHGNPGRIFKSHYATEKDLKALKGK